MVKDSIHEPARSTKITGNSDVIVCGGGPAGIAAAVATARSGASVRLLEMHGELGGIWTTGLLSWVIDCGSKSGFIREIVEEMISSGNGRMARNVDFICDVERLKLVLEARAAQAGVALRYHTSVVSAAVDSGTGTITHVVTESKSGREAWGARVFIDATGDGDLGYFSGCGFQMGHPETGKTQPMTLEMHIGGVASSLMEPFDYTTKVPGRLEGKRRLAEIMASSGVHPSYPSPTLFHLGNDLYILQTNHEFDVLGTNADDLTRATLEARRELHSIIDGLRSLGGMWSNIHVVNTAAKIGVREGRRIEGLYTVTKEDLIQGRAHPDGICHVTFPFDVHATSRITESGFEHPAERAKPYDIPLRSLIAKDRINLIMAGRCISGDFWAHSSYRVTGDAVVTGEAAGILAALSVRQGRSPRDINFRDVLDAQRSGTAAALP
jgi:hypothetical protein